MKIYRVGIDIGSTTVKLVVLDEHNEIIFGDYRRHHAHTQETLNSLLKSARQKIGNCILKVKITGSGSINPGKALDIEFVQEVVAVAAALSEKTAADRLVKTAAEEWNIPEKEVRSAVHTAWAEQQNAKAVIREEGRRVYESMRTRGGRGIVLAGRPYHIDPEINHGIPELIDSYGLYVYTEDSLPVDDNLPPLRVVDQWV